MQHNHVDVEATVIGDKERAMFALIEQNKALTVLVDKQQELLVQAGQSLRKTADEVRKLLEIIQKISGGIR